MTTQCPTTDPLVVPPDAGSLSCLRPATSLSVAITSDVVSAETVALDPSAGPASDAVQSSEPVSEMTHTLLSRTLNPSIPYHTSHQIFTDVSGHC